MQLAKDFKRSNVWTRQHPETPATRMSQLLTRSWGDAQSVVNDRQSAVVLYGRNQLDGILVPPSLIYESRRKLPVSRYTEPVFHVSAKEFKESYSADSKSNICADFLRSGASVVVTNKAGSPILGLLPVQETALLDFDDQGRVQYNGDLGENMFCDADPYEEGTPFRNEFISAVKSERAKLHQAIDVLDNAKQTRDDLHDAIRQMRFDMS